MAYKKKKKKKSLDLVFDVPSLFLSSAPLDLAYYTLTIFNSSTLIYQSCSSFGAFVLSTPSARNALSLVDFIAEFLNLFKYLLYYQFSMRPILVTLFNTKHCTISGILLALLYFFLFFSHYLIIGVTYYLSPLHKLQKNKSINFYTY